MRRSSSTLSSVTVATLVVESSRVVHIYQATVLTINIRVLSTSAAAALRAEYEALSKKCVAPNPAANILGDDAETPGLGPGCNDGRQRQCPCGLVRPSCADRCICGNRAYVKFDAPQKYPLVA